MNATVSPPLKWHMLEKRPIPGCPGYFARTDGTIWSHLFGKEKQLFPDVRHCDGRKRYTVKTNAGKLIRKYGGEFTLLAFVGPRPHGMECCHGDGVCTNDAIWNLRWDTALANKADMVRHGTRPSGESHGLAKLTKSAVISIRDEIAKGLACPGAVAARFGVSRTTVRNIISGKIWRETNVG